MKEVNKYGSIINYKEESKRIIKNVAKLRKLKAGKETDWKEAAEWHLKYSNLDGTPSLALTITLSPSGCDWARQGGCTMCGEFEGSYKRKKLLKNPQFHISQFASAIGNSELWDAVNSEGKDISWIRINQEGNFTNPNETSKEAQEIILRLAMRIKSVKRITIESRPQYLDETTLIFLEDIFKNSDVELEIGMGFESQNDIVRNICINKQEHMFQFINTIQLLKKHNILPLAYILLKPPFLTEKEAIDEAVETAHCAANIGFERISFEPMSIHQYTLVDVLKETGDYKAPWLWSVIEVTKRCADISNIFGVGGVGYYPIPTEYAHNYCFKEDNCNKLMIDAIKSYNECRDVSVFNELSCICKKNWEDECSIKEKTLKERINEQLDRVELVIDDYSPDIIENEVCVRNQRIIIGNSQK